MKVLMIASNVEIIERISLCIKLRWPGAVLLPVAEGTKGIELIQTESPDIAILDLDLPNIDAFLVLGQIRLFSDVPIIVLSNGDDEIRRVKALEMGADKYISQLFSPLEFIARVQALLRRAAMSALKGGRLPSFVRDGECP